MIKIACLIIIFIAACSETKNILILSTPAYSYSIRAANIARELNSYGYNVTMVLPDRSVGKFIKSNYGFVNAIISDAVTKFADIANEVARKLITKGFQSGSGLDFASAKKGLSQICYELNSDEKLFQRLRTERFDIAILSSGLINTCASVIPYKLSIPFVREEVMGFDIRRLLHAHPAVFPINVVGPTTDNMSYLQRLGNTMFHLLWQMNIASFNPSDVVGLFASEMPHATNDQMIAMAELYLLNYDELIDYHLPLYPNTIPVGGLSTRQPNQLKGEPKLFMDSATEGAVIVSFGSVVNYVPDNIRKTLMEVFMSLKHMRFIFKVGNSTETVENVFLTSWIPQNDLLAHPNAKLFITHCGHNAQYDALYNAVPVIGLGVFGDQHYNAIKMEAKGFGIALRIHEFTSNDLVMAINRVIKTPSYKENILNASIIFKSRSMTPANRAAWWIDYVVKYGGKHLRPTVATIPFYQYLLLDVVVGIILIMVTFVYLIYILSKILCQVFCKLKLKRD